MKPLLALSLVAALGVCPLAAEAAVVCYVNFSTEQSPTVYVYESAPFKYDGDDVEASPQAKAFFAHARKQYGLPADATEHCRVSVYSVKDELQMQSSDEFTMGGKTFRPVLTRFKPPKR